MRLDLYLTEKFKNQYSRKEIQNFIKKNFVFIDNQVANKASKKINIITDVDKIELKVDENVLTEESKKNNESKCSDFNIKLDIVYENQNLAIINKPVGLTTHPGAGNKDHTLMNAVITHYGKEKLSNVRGDERIGIIHRLDKNTSGLIIIAKNNKSHRLLSEMIKNKTIERKYLALCYGIPKPMNGVIKNYIIRDNKNIEQMKISDNENPKAKIAITHYKVLEILCNGLFSLVECTLETGRTHQIRLHMLSIGHPIVGDNIYKNNKYTQNLQKINKENLTKKELKILDFIIKQKTQMLHSYSINFIEPITKKHIKICNNHNWY